MATARATISGMVNTCDRQCWHWHDIMNNAGATSVYTSVYSFITTPHIHPPPPPPEWYWWGWDDWGGQGTCVWLCMIICVVLMDIVCCWYVVLYVCMVFSYALSCCCLCCVCVCVRVHVCVCGGGGVGSVILSWMMTAMMVVARCVVVTIYIIIVPVPTIPIHVATIDIMRV